MASQNISSESEEMYLVKLAQLVEDGHPVPVPLPVLAQALGVQPVSANQMVRRLCDTGLLTYEPYKGVDFTPIGNQLTQKILRFRRLWSVFLAEHLGFSPVEADTLACALEHQTTPDLGDRLARFLDHPQEDPLGKPIPDSVDRPIRPTGVALSELTVGVAAQVLAIPADGPVHTFLLACGIRSGTPVTVRGRAEQDALLVASETQLVCLAPEIAAQVTVLPSQPKETL
jgi:DtxR family Mn-dependent transcriptional regulator